VLPKFIDGAHTAGIKDATSGDDTFAEILVTDLHDLIGLVPDFPGLNARWFTSKLGKAIALDRLMYAGSGNTVQNLSAGAPGSFLGYEVVTSPALPKVATAINNTIMLLFGDLSLACTMGVRREQTLRMSDQRYFEYDQIGYLLTTRFDIVCHDIGSTSVAGPLVGFQGNT